MTDTYQAVFDAVRSKIGGCDVGQIVREACHFDASFEINSIKNEAEWAIATVRDEMQRPAVIYRPAIAIDGNQWCALYGENLMEGVAGFGDSPALAMADFDKNWNAALPVKRITKDELMALHDKTMAALRGTPNE